MKRIAALLCVMLSSVCCAQEQAEPKQVDVELKIIALGVQDVEDLARKGPVDGDALLSLWQEGRGRLVAAPRTTTQSGLESTLKAVVEYIYPTEFRTIPAATNKTATAETFATPSDFETREVGVIFSFLAEISQPGLINLTLSHERCQPPEWHDYGRRTRLPGGTETQVPMEAPFFRSDSIQTSVAVKPDCTVLVGGGTPNEDGKDLLYMFVTVRLIDAAGKPLPTK